jgi:hypothetical protein
LVDRRERGARGCHLVALFGLRTHDLPKNDHRSSNAIETPLVRLILQHDGEQSSAERATDAALSAFSVAQQPLH